MIYFTRLLEAVVCVLSDFKRLVGVTIGSILPACQNEFKRLLLYVKGLLLSAIGKNDKNTKKLYFKIVSVSMQKAIDKDNVVVYHKVTSGARQLEQKRLKFTH